MALAAILISPAVTKRNKLWINESFIHGKFVYDTKSHGHVATFCPRKHVPFISSMRLTLCGLLPGSNKISKKIYRCCTIY